MAVTLNVALDFAVIVILAGSLVIERGGLVLIVDAEEEVDSELPLAAPRARRNPQGNNRVGG